MQWPYGLHLSTQYSIISDSLDTKAVADYIALHLYIT